MKNECITFRIPSGLNVSVSKKLENDINNFKDNEYFMFNNIINAGQYFPQIMQFIFAIVAMLNGYNSFLEILFINIISGLFFTLLWYILKFYKIPGLSFLSCFIGGNFFRFFLHFIVIILICIFVINDWKIILYCLIGGFITQIIKSFFIAKFSSIKYNDDVILYIKRLKL